MLAGEGDRSVERANPSEMVRRHMQVGLGVVLLLVGGLGGWAATAELAGAVLAEGTVVVDSNVKKVQHPTGGIVGEIKVRDGDTVATGDLLLRLDETVTRANLMVVAKQLDELAMRQSRLKAERDGGAGADIPRQLIERQHVPEIAEIVAGEQSLFESRRKGRASQAAQLRERIVQLREEIAGVSAQHVAKVREGELVREELAGLERLERKKLMTTNRITLVRREVARLDGEKSQLVASMAQVRGKIAEIELQLLQLDQDIRTEVVKELREVQAKEAELAERRIAAEDQLKRVEIRSPQAGIVHQLAVHTVGGVINQSEPVMLVVPKGDRLVIEARISPRDIEQVRAGQGAFLRFTAFNQRTTPELEARVDRVSADLTKDLQTNVVYYVARIAVSDGELQRLGASKLVPGTPVDVQIRTGDRTALSYLVKPLQDQIMKAFRER
jgi:HlyD family secretion protein